MSFRSSKCRFTYYFLNQTGDTIMKTVRIVALKRHIIVTLLCLVMFAGSASVSLAGVTTVRMKIAGYLCGN